MITGATLAVARGNPMRVLSRRREADVWLTLSGEEPGLDSASGDDGELGTRAAASGEPGRDSASGDNEGPGGGIIAPPRARFPYRRGG